LSTKNVFPATLLTLLASLLALATLLLQYGIGTAQGPVGLGTDTDPGGNTATSLGTRDDCISVEADDTFEFDVIVSDVDDLVAWELYLRFDPSIIEVVDADMDMFLANNPQSSLIRKSDYYVGWHFLGAADRRLLGESGSGVLARLTLHAKADGFSHIDIPSIDFDGDGDIDKGPRLTNSEGDALGDVTGDHVFDGLTNDALIAVNESCDAAPPTPPGGGTTPPGTPPPTDVLPVPGDPTVEPPLYTTPATDDGSASENGEDSASESEPEGASEASPNDEDSEDSATDGSRGSDEADTSEDGAATAALAGDATPAPGDGGDSDQAAGGASLPSTSSGGGLPLWAIGSIAAAILVAAAGTSVYLAARAGERLRR
jgi:hypothetical protein